MGILNSQKVQRNWFAALAGVMIVSNIALSIYINFQDRMVVIVPTHISKEFEISNSHITPNYLEMRARDVVQSFLNLTPQNIEYFEEILLGMAHPKFHGELQQQIGELRKDVKGREVRTFFVINETNVAIDNLEVEVTGYLETFVGSRQTSTELKKYLIGFDYSNARLLLTKFYEAEQEEGKEGESDA